MKIEQDCVASPTTKVIKYFCLLHQIISFLPLLSLTVLPDSLNQIVNIAYTPSFFSWWTSRYCSLHIILCCFGMCFLQRFPVSLLILHIKMTPSVVCNNSMKLIATFSVCFK